MLKKYIDFVKESLLTEAKKSGKLKDSERSVLLLDGTGSAGKSFTLKEIGAKKPIHGEKVGDNDYEVIAYDDYYPADENVDNTDPKDPANQRRWKLEEEAGIPKEVRDWAKKSGDFACNASGYKKMFQDAVDSRTEILEKLKAIKNPTAEDVLKAAGEKVGSDGDMTKEEFKKMGPKEALKFLIDTQEKKIAYNKKVVDETPDYKHPDMPEGEFAIRWYMAQQYKKSTAKNVVFDDVEPNINKFLPKGTVKNVLLHADPAKLGSNIASREKKDPRDPAAVFNDYLNKYEFTKEKPKDGDGDPGKPTTKAQMESTLKGLTKKAGLSLSTVDDDFIKDWLSRSGMKEDGTYYMKVRDEYMKENKPVLINSDKDGEFLKKFKKIAEEEEARVAKGEKKVEPTAPAAEEKPEEKIESEGAKVSPELKMPQRNDWVEKVLIADWDKENGGKLAELKEKAEKLEKGSDERSKADDEVGKLRDEITEKLKKDPKYGKAYNEFLEKNDRYYALVDKLNKAGGLEKFEKENPKEYNEVLDLHANHMSPFTLTKRPGGVLQITSQDMDGGDDSSKLGAAAFRKKMNEYIDKNGKPKGVIMDLRTNTGGSQETAKGMTDYFVDDDDYTIEQQRYATGVRRFRDLPYPEGLKKALDLTDEPKIKKYVDSLSEEDKKKYWEESKKNGDLSYQNTRKNAVDKKYRLSGIPTVVQTSIRTFSAGEFTSDTIKNLNPNAVHIGHNTGGGANQTFGALMGDDEKNNKDKSTTEKAKLAANAYKFSYWNEEEGKKIHDAILAKIKSGEINDKMDTKKLADEIQNTGRKVTGDDHIECHINDGNLDPMVPQVKSDRVKVDPKTKKPILKDGKMQFDGNWERTGVGSGKTSAFIESDPNTATKDALEYIYKKNGDTKLIKELNTDPEKFGIDKNGKDGLYDSESKSKQSAFVNEGNERQSKQLQTSIKAVELNKKNKKSVAEQLEEAEKAFRGEDEKDEPEVENTQKIYAGFDEAELKKLKDTVVTYKDRDDKKPKKIQLETLMDWLPVDINDPDDKLKMKVQKLWYIKINEIRVKQELNPLIDYEVWIMKRIKRALKTNKEYIMSVKNKNKDNKPNITDKPKPKNEGRLLDYKSFITEKND